MSDITDRIAREVGVDGLVDILSDCVTPTDLTALLLEVYRRHASKRTPSAVLADYSSNRFVQPTSSDPRLLVDWDRLAFGSLPPEFVPIELAPVCPLGTNSTVATVSQNNAISTSRNVEVVSDPTNVLALECALRRRALLTTSPKSSEAVHLATSHRVVRPQFAVGPHFRLFSLSSAGRDTDAFRFHEVALFEHLGFYLRVLTQFLTTTATLRVSLTILGEVGRERYSGPVDALRERHPAVDVGFDDERTSGRGYYRDVCFKIYAYRDGERVELADGGSVDWTARLLSNAKERLFISGIGSDRVCGLRGKRSVE